MLDELAEVGHCLMAQVLKLMLLGPCTHKGFGLTIIWLERRA